MDKIVVCGATAGSNFGDLLFASAVEKHILKEVDNVEVVFIRASKFATNDVKIKEAVIGDLLNAKALIYMPGGYFGDSDRLKGLKGSILSVIFFCRYYLYGLISILNNRPIAIIGVGAGPLFGLFSKLAVVAIFNRAKIITVRDYESKNYLLKYGVNQKIDVVTDAALSFGRKMLDSSEGIPRGLPKDIICKNIVLIHITKSTAMEKYCEIVVQAIADIMGSDKECVFVLTDDYATKNKYFEMAASLLPSDRTYTLNFSSSIELLKLIKLSKIIITPKLHVGIFGCLCEKVVISFPVHAEKTVRFYKQIGYIGHCIPIENISYKEAKRIIEECKNDVIKIPEYLKIESESNFEKLSLFLKKCI